MRLLASTPQKLFLTCWIVYSAHFATNVVREHYPAFSLAEHGTLQVDEYLGLHSDIFQHTDGHAYVNNQVTVSVLAAVPLVLFDPLLDELEDRRRRQVAQQPAAAEAHYDTEYPLRQRFFAEVRARGLDLRFGAAAAQQEAVHQDHAQRREGRHDEHRRERRGVRASRALWLALLFAFATPLFLRTSVLSNNLLVMYGVFASFALLAFQGEAREPPGAGRRAAAGFAAAAAVAADYSGLVSAPFLYALCVVPRVRTAGWRRALLESVPFLLGAALPIAFLLYTQWAMYGHPLYPGQYWMPEVNYTDRGWRGFAPPDLDLFLQNLIGLDWGLLPFAPLLALGLVPARLLPGGPLVLPRPERRWALAYAAAFLVFCSANQYARMQWNTGFRYLLPLVPLLFLAACDPLARLSRRTLVLISVPVLLHSWVLTVVRYLAQPHLSDEDAITGNWRRFLEGGVQLPWLNVLRQTTPDPDSIVHWGGWPFVALGLVGLAVAAVWTRRSPGARAA